MGTDIAIVDRFPRELIGSTGFDNDAATLSFQAALMERYIPIAENAVDRQQQRTMGFYRIRRYCRKSHCVDSSVGLFGDGPQSPNSNRHSVVTAAAAKKGNRSWIASNAR